MTRLHFIPELNYLVTGGSDKFLKIFYITINNNKHIKKATFIFSLLGHSGNIMSIKSMKLSESSMILLTGDN